MTEDKTTEKAGKTEAEEAPKTPTFVKPITIAGVKYSHYEMRMGTVADLFTAETELANKGLGTHTPLQFNGEMMLLQLVRVYNQDGTEFRGPFTKNMLMAWGISNYNLLRNEQNLLELLGEI